MININMPVNLQSIGANAFENCDSLTNITIPANVDYIGEKAFLGCPNLKYTVDIGNQIFASIDNSLYSKNSKFLFYYSDTASKIAYTALNELEEIFEYAFANTNYVKNINLCNVNKIDRYAFINSGVEVVTSSNLLEYIGSSAFDNTPWLYNNTDNNGMAVLGKNLVKYTGSQTQIMPSLFPNGITNISGGAFANTNIVNMELPSELDTIYEDAFYNCQNLESIIYSSTTAGYIGEYAFANCGSLEIIDFRGQIAPLVSSNLFYKSNNNLTIYIPYRFESIYANMFEYYFNLYNHSYLEFEISFDIQDGSAVENINVYYTQNLGILPVSEKLGYDFAGWFDSEVGGNEYFSYSDWSEARDGTLYAHWSLHDYDINYYVDEQKDYSNSYDYHFNMTETPVLLAPNLDSWLVFTNWSISATENIPISNISLATTEDINVYAFYEYIDYEVTFVLDNGEPDIIKIIKYGEILEVPHPKKTGCYNDCWSRDVNGASEVYSTNNFVWNKAENVKLHANWLQGSYVIKYINDEEGTENG